MYLVAKCPQIVHIFVTPPEFVYSVNGGSSNVILRVDTQACGMLSPRNLPSQSTLCRHASAVLIPVLYQICETRKKDDTNAT